MLCGSGISTFFPSGGALSVCEGSKMLPSLCFVPFSFVFLGIVFFVCRVGWGVRVGNAGAACKRDGVPRWCLVGWVVSNLPME